MTSLPTRSPFFFLFALVLLVSLSAVNPLVAQAAGPAKAPFTHKAATSTHKTGTSTQTVDINHADAETIAATLKGIGLKKAQSIVAYRNKMGSFKSVGQLAEVKGIGPKMLELNKGRIVVK